MPSKHGKKREISPERGILGDGPHTTFSATAVTVNTPAVKAEPSIVRVLPSATLLLCNVTVKSFKVLPVVLRTSKAVRLEFDVCVREALAKL
jgi:hypothetical protein